MWWWSEPVIPAWISLVSSQPAFILFPSPSILFIPVEKKRWMLRRERFHRLANILGFFDGDEQDGWG
jgi:hypothetical protein